MALQLGDLDELLGGDEARPGGGRDRLDYSKWEYLSDDGDADAEAQAETPEQKALWQRMVAASGLGGDEAADDAVDEWRVVHAPFVAVRASPSVTSKLVSVRRPGDVVRVDYTLEALWAKLDGEVGWMLTHGAELGLGALLEPV
mmetsp:Transcript_17515/g.60608  ORF Transcript_17515/g.60608 Transcript_17515/m.60608 type:complete len:144 (+) Transcript_17515:743-1174(+)